MIKLNLLSAIFSISIITLLWIIQFPFSLFKLIWNAYLNDLYIFSNVNFVSCFNKIPMMESEKLITTFNNKVCLNGKFDQIKKYFPNIIYEKYSSTETKVIKKVLANYMQYNLSSSNTIIYDETKFAHYLLPENLEIFKDNAAWQTPYKHLTHAYGGPNSYYHNTLSLPTGNIASNNNININSIVNVSYSKNLRIIPANESLLFHPNANFTLLEAIIQKQISLNTIYDKFNLPEYTLKVDRLFDPHLLLALEQHIFNNPKISHEMLDSVGLINVPRFGTPIPNWKGSIESYNDLRSIILQGIADQSRFNHPNNQFISDVREIGVLINNHDSLSFTDYL